MEVEFSFKDLFFYAVKKWIVVVIAAILGAVALSGLFLLNQKNFYNDDVFKGSVKFYSITEFIEDNHLLISADSPSAEGVYNQIAYRVLGYIVEPAVKDEFINDEKVIEKFRIIFDSVNDTEYDFYKEFSKNFGAWHESSSVVAVQFTGRLDTQEKQAAALWILNNYMDRAIGYALQHVNPSQIPNNAIERHSPVRLYQGLEDIGQGSIISSAIKGFMFGMVGGAAIILLIYFFDPRVKSYSQVKPFAPNLIAKVQGAEPESEPVINICARTQNDKIVLIAGTKNDVFVPKLAKAVSEQYKSVGVKALVVDFCSDGDGTLLSEYLNGKCAVSGDTIIVSEASEWTQLLSKKDEFLKLKNQYDKIILAYSDIYSGGAVVLSGMSDKSVLVINQKLTKLNDIRALVSDFDKAEMCVGAYIYNSL